MEISWMVKPAENTTTKIPKGQWNYDKNVDWFYRWKKTKMGMQPDAAKFSKLTYLCIYYVYIYIYIYILIVMLCII